MGHIKQPTPIMNNVMLLSYRSGFVHSRYMSGNEILFTVVAHHLLCGFLGEWTYVSLTIKGENVER
jgi:hypothetical protein